MKKVRLLFSVLLLGFASLAQDDVKTLHETAKNFMVTGDFDNAILVLNRALVVDKNNLDLQKDLAMTHYLKRDYVKALETVKVIVDRDDADVVSFQIAGNVYKALEEVKDAEKLYKKALKKFPKSGPLYSEYGELLWAAKDYSAIGQWEKGIQVDPAYPGNYYNAALFYFYTKDKVWSLIYGEIFVNMESLSERGAAMKQLLLQGYKEKLFAEADVMKGDDKRSEFAKAFLQSMAKQSGLARKGVTTEVLTMIRARFILDWFATYSNRFPFRLFDYQRQLLQEGMFEAYNQWLFGVHENLPAYDTWIRMHDEQYKNFVAFQKSRVFRMPAGQYYQDSK
ncbi:MAG TPA: tetratricopeptide repeat protein [Chitinophagaceae bacterium]|nr:tetratricopeptide repeat protein [Chitinophagaceae bacterium]